MDHTELIPEGTFGIERETLRVTANEKLAQTPHPFQNAYLERDFCENQLEIITPPCQSISSAMQILSELDKRARECLLQQGETLWKYSNPPHIESEDEIPVAFFQEESRSGKNSYRHYLELKYGKRLMLLSGIHFNVSFSQKWLETQHLKKAPDQPFYSFRDQFYLRLARQAMTWSWLLVLLTAASPVHLYEQMQLTQYASVRNSADGYWNEFVPKLDYSDLQNYVRSVEEYVEKGVLYSAAELYLPIRLKPKGVNRIHALLNGISHIELRMFDLNPLEPLGIAEKDLQFAYLLLVFLSQKEDLSFTPELQAKAIAHHQAAALFHLDGIDIDGMPVLSAAHEMLDSMAAYFAESREALDTIHYERDKLTNRLCEQIAALPGDQLRKLILI